MPESLPHVAGCSVSTTRRDDGAAPESGSSRSGWLDVVATVLLALAAVATAWSSYQAARWTAQQTGAFSAANAARVEATQSSALADAQTQIDIAVFVQWTNARVEGQHDLAAFYRARFRPEFVPAFDAWLSTDPFHLPEAPLTPFALPQYVVAARVTAEQLNAQAEASSSQARENIQHATNYVLGVVLFAISLFFAGVSTKMRSARTRSVVLVIGCIVFIGAVGWIASLPINVAV
jgi:hypothetical protein